MQHAQKQRSEVRRQLVEETMRCRGTLDAWETLQEQIATMQPKQVQRSSREGKRPHASRSTWSNAKRGKCGAWLKQRQGTPCRRVDCLSNPTKLRGRTVGLPARPVLDKMGRFRSGKLELDVNRPRRPSTVLASRKGGWPTSTPKPSLAKWYLQRSPEGGAPHACNHATEPRE